MAPVRGPRSAPAPGHHAKLAELPRAGLAGARPMPRHEAGAGWWRRRPPALHAATAGAQALSERRCAGPPSFLALTEPCSTSQAKVPT